MVGCRVNSVESPRTCTWVGKVKMSVTGGSRKKGNLRVQLSNVCTTSAETKVTACTKISGTRESESRVGGDRWESKKRTGQCQGFPLRFQLDGGGGVLPLPFCCCWIRVAIGRSEGSGPVFTLGRGCRISAGFGEERSTLESLRIEGPFCW
jgi:hypothetical protein